MVFGCGNGCVRAISENVESGVWLGMDEEKAEGHPNAPQLPVVVGVATQGSEVLNAAPHAVASGELHEGAGTAGGAPHRRVALAGAISGGDEVVGGDLCQLALPEGEGLALLSVGALAGAAVRGGSEEGGVWGAVGVARGLPSGRGVAVPVGNREGGYVGG